MAQIGWQVGGTAAELYQRYLVPAIASLWATDLIDRSAPRPGERVLDVACGTGVVTRLAAERMGAGRIVGLDINSGMLAVARSRVFTAIEHTPASNALADALDRHLGAGASQTKRSEHVLSDSQELRELVAAAGFGNVAIKTATQTIRFPSAKEFVRVQLSATPLSSLMDGMDDTRQREALEAITRDLVTALDIGSDTAELTYPQEAYVLLASR
jgi:hypothetical protein